MTRRQAGEWKTGNWERPCRRLHKLLTKISQPASTSTQGWGFLVEERR